MAQATFGIRLAQLEISSKPCTCTVSKASENAEPRGLKKLCRLFSKIKCSVIDARSNLKGPVKDVYLKMLKYDITLVVTRLV